MPSHTVSSSTTPSNPPVKKEAQQSWEKQQVLTIAQLACNDNLFEWI